MFSGLGLPATLTLPLQHLELGPLSGNSFGLPYQKPSAGPGHSFSSLLLDTECSEPTYLSHKVHLFPEPKTTASSPLETPTLAGHKRNQGGGICHWPPQPLPTLIPSLKHCPSAQERSPEQQLQKSGASPIPDTPVFLCSH